MLVCMPWWSSLILFYFRGFLLVAWMFSLREVPSFSFSWYSLWYLLSIFLVCGNGTKRVGNLRLKRPNWRPRYAKAKIEPIGLLVAFIALQALVSGESSNNQRSIEFFLELFPAFVFFYIIFIAPIIEEFITRGLMAKYLFSKQETLGQTLLYIALSSSLFSFLHLPSSLWQFLTYFIMGSIFALAYLTKEDIRYAIALHIANNLIASLLIFLLQ